MSTPIGVVCSSGVIVSVEVIRCPNAAYFPFCGTLDNRSHLPSEYDDIQQVDGWDYKELFSS